jgi:hypothetical protein
VVAVNLLPLLQKKSTRNLLQKKSTRNLLLLLLLLLRKKSTWNLLQKKSTWNLRRLYRVQLAITGTRRAMRVVTRKSLPRKGT